MMESEPPNERPSMMPILPVPYGILETGRRTEAIGVPGDASGQVTAYEEAGYVPPASLSLPSSVRKALQESGAGEITSARRQIETAGTWAVVSALCEQVLNDYETHTLEPRRLAWSELAGVMTDFTFTGVQVPTSADITKRLKWHFVHPRLHDIGEGNVVPLHIDLEATVPPRNTMQSGLRHLYGQAAYGDIDRRAVRKAMRALGVPAGRVGLPDMESWAQPFTDAFLQHADVLTASACIPALGDMPARPVMSATLRREDLRRPDTVIFDRHYLSRWSGQADHLELNEQTVDIFTRRAGHAALRGLAGGQNKMAIKSMRRLMGQHLDTDNTVLGPLHDLAILARESTIVPHE